MVRSAHSRAVAISAGRASAAGSVGRSASRRTRSASWRTAAIAVLFVALTTDDDASSTDHCAIHPRDYTRRVCLGYFDECVAFSEIDLSHVIARNSAFTGDRAHQVADLHAIASADGHEEADHSIGTATSSGLVAIRRPDARDRRCVFGCLASLGALALEELQRGSCDFSGVKFFE
jgi:hypothetical protein